PGRRVPRSRVALVVAPAAALLVIVTAWTALEIRGSQATSDVAGVAQALAACAVIVTTATRARREHERSTRVGSLLLSLAYFGRPGEEAPTAVGGLALGDLGFVAGAALSMPAVLLLAGRMLGGSRLRLVLDGSMIAAAVLLMSWLTTVQSLLQGGVPTPQDIF